MATLNFDSTTVDTTSFKPLDPGDYLAVITESEIKDNKAGTGQYIKLTFEIIGEKGKGRKVWDLINHKNSNSQAQEIGEKRLALLCEALSVSVLKDTYDLHDKQLMISLAIEKQPGYNPVNKITKYSTVAKNPTQNTQGVSLEETLDKPSWS